MMTLGKVLSENRGNGPGFHLVRHVLAGAILVFHCYLAIIGRVIGPAASANAPTLALHHGGVIELLRPFLFALVGAFFAVSGFLVTGSALRTRDTRVFLMNRGLRILPALSAEVLLSAFILGPLVTTFALSRYFSDPLFGAYFWNLVGHVQFLLPGVFTANPWSDTVNLSLWTLPAELWCYAIMLVILASGLIAHRLRLTMTIAAGFILVVMLSLYDPVTFAVKANSTHFSTWYIVCLFFIGSLAFLFADRVPLHPALFVAALAAYYVMVRWDVAITLSGVPLVYLVLYVGMVRFDWFDRLLKMDLSYGTYLYGFPITQALVHFTRPALANDRVWAQLAVIAPLAALLTAAFAVASWNVIEKPALSLRRFVARRPIAERAPT